MSLFRKFFGSNNPSSEEENDNENGKFSPDINAPLDEQFIYNFKKNGGKFLYCENEAEVKDHFENILEENDWFERRLYVTNQIFLTCLKKIKLPMKNQQILYFF